MLMITNMKNVLRKYLLMSASPSRSICLTSVSVTTRAGGVPGSPRGKPCVTTGINLLGAGMFPLLLFQGVCPVILSISPAMILESCALIAGSLSGFLMGLVWAGGVPPLPPLPLPGCLVPRCVVARNLHPQAGMLQNKIADWSTDQSSRGDDM